MCQSEGDRHSRLEAIAGADNLYSLIMIFGRGHLAIKVGGAVYVARCVPVEVIPQSLKNLAFEIPFSFVFFCASKSIFLFSLYNIWV